MEHDGKSIKENVPEPPSFALVPKTEYDRKFNCTKNKYKKKVKRYFKTREDYYNKKAKPGEQKSKDQEAFNMGVIQWTGQRYQIYKQQMWNGKYDDPFKAVKNGMLNRPLNRDVVVRRGNNSFKGLARALGMIDPDNATPGEIIRGYDEEELSMPTASAHGLPGKVMNMKL